MREIKFRVWDTIHNTFLWFFTSDVIDTLFGQSHSDTPLPERTGRIFARTQEIYKLQQYTGLKDKNGKEIYEGDIVKEVYVPLNSYPDIIQYYKEGIIVWNYKGFGVLLKIEGAKILDESRKLSYHKTVRKVYSHPTQGENWVDNNVSFNRLEIIGNIYENPELIEPCKD